MKSFQETDKALPVILRVAKTSRMDTNIYNHTESYNHETEMLDKGTYWMGSKTSNTRCNKFTVFGADKKHADDTKEKN
jgi:hypothetical protein